MKTAAFAVSAVLASCGPAALASEPSISGYTPTSPVGAVNSFVGNKLKALGTAAGAAEWAYALGNVSEPFSGSVAGFGSPSVSQVRVTRHRLSLSHLDLTLPALSCSPHRSRVPQLASVFPGPTRAAFEAFYGDNQYASHFIENAINGTGMANGLTNKAR